MPDNLPYFPRFSTLGTIIIKSENDEKIISPPAPCPLPPNFEF
jgi:hypothetical protein